MSRIAALGEETQVRGYALAGALVIVAEQPDQVRAAWRSLPADVAVVILTPTAAAAVNAVAAPPSLPLTVILPCNR
ncbi:hypothetical protein AB0F81_13010 [Actinoplanes sp. NPDC024001]|uniref:hypothetical protein n=1 Tax=Actinoplanes sp. NPDC024001 TaxID=3154598 RepID=UPI0033F738EA